MSRLLVGRANERVSLLVADGVSAANVAAEEWKREATNALSNASTSDMRQSLRFILDNVKQKAVADPDMWAWVTRSIKESIDEFGNDIALYMHAKLHDTIATTVGSKSPEQFEELTKKGTERFFLHPHWWRARVLYHFIPFDKSIFGQFKDPCFWILTWVSCYPTYGLRCIFFTILLFALIVPCPPDEYQITRYILRLKGSQFVTGIVLAVTATSKFFMCIHPDGTHTCDVAGPGVEVTMAENVIDYGGSCILVWVALVTLQFTSAGTRELTIGGTRELVDDEETPVVEAISTKNRIAPLLGWDLFAFLLSLGLLYFLACVDTAHLRPGGQEATLAAAIDVTANLQDVRGPEFLTRIYLVRIVYALLSLPFMLFQIPVLGSMLTHTSPTGFNKNGACVALMLKPMP